MSFVSRGLQGVRAGAAHGGRQSIVFGRDLAGPCTVSTAEPLRGPGRVVFEVCACEM